MKKYNLEKSPFYKLKSKKRLMDLLGLKSSCFNDRSFNKYKVYQLSSGRWIEEPQDKLKRIQKRIQTLLSRIKTPPFLFSGKKGVSYVDNARHHLGNAFIISTDIISFYQSCRKEYVNKFFVLELKVSSEVARFLTSVVTYNDYIPTGSPSSQIVAYFAYSKTFNRIYEFSKNRYVRFSIYVDDLNFSSNNRICWKFLSGVRYELKKVGLRLKRAKTRFYTSSDPKKITGCVITPKGKLSVPNSLREKIMSPLKKGCEVNEMLAASILGRICAARQIEPNIFSGVLARLQF